MIGKCRLTLNECELQNSHIYPKFVIEWMKLTGSKFQRNYISPNWRLQDGYKRPLLSEKAELLFSKGEKWFSENVFHNYLKNRNYEIEYNENLFYFAISFLWRILILEIESLDAKNFKFTDELFEAEKEWRDFLLNGIYPRNYDRIHLILTDDVVNHTLPSENVDYFFTRSLDGTIAFNEEYNKCSVFAKFAKFIFWGFVKSPDESGLIGTKIDPIKGKMKAPQQFSNVDITSFLIHRIRLYDEMPLASEKQQEIIMKEILSNKEHYKNSELFDSMVFDSKMKKKNENNNW